MGELARQPDAPYFADTPLELLNAKEKEKPSWLSKNFFPIAGGFTGPMITIFMNRIRMRPAWAGIHFHFLSGLSLFLLGYKYNEMRLEADAERYAIYKHYISLHPEDFPPFEKQRIKDLFAPWHPCR